MTGDAEYEVAIRNLKKANWKVDYILTHCAPDSIASRIGPPYKPDLLTGLLELIKEKCTFDWRK